MLKASSNVGEPKPSRRHSSSFWYPNNTSKELITHPENLAEQKALIEKEKRDYFNTYYANAARYESPIQRSFGMSLSEVGATDELRQANEHFRCHQYTLAAHYYAKASRSPAYLCEAFYKIGLCLLNGARGQDAGLTSFRIYPKQVDEKTSQYDLAALFFREVLALSPYVDDNEFRVNQCRPQSNFVNAIYSLSICISNGVAINPQDLLSTPWAGYMPEKVPAKELEIALLERVLFHNPEHKEAKTSLSLLVAPAFQLSAP